MSPTRDGVQTHKVAAPRAYLPLPLGLLDGSDAETEIDRCREGLDADEC